MAPIVSPSLVHIRPPLSQVYNDRPLCLFELCRSKSTCVSSCWPKSFSLASRNAKSLSSFESLNRAAKCAFSFQVCLFVCLDGEQVNLACFVALAASESNLLKGLSFLHVSCLCPLTEPDIISLAASAGLFGQPTSRRHLARVQARRRRRRKSGLISCGGVFVFSLSLYR